MSLLAPDDPWAAYADTVVQIVRPAEGDFVTVRAAPVGAPTRRDRSMALAREDPVCILTAWDPGDERPGVEVNRRRGAELESAGCDGGRAGCCTPSVSILPRHIARRASPCSGCP